MKLKKVINSILACFILNFTIFCNYSFATNLEIFSESAILIEKNTGKVLYSKSSDEKRYPASTTKILTAILAIEHLSLDQKLTASHDAIMSIPSGYSIAAIQIGEALTVQELLEVFLVHSANEAGFILAEGVSVSIPAFAKLMNEKAKEIGCKNTNFTNPSGLHDENHYTTAHDLALIAKYCMENKTFRSIVSMPSCTIAPTDKYEERYFKSTNDMLNPKSQYYNPNIIGIKTGYTKQAQNCLIAGFKKDDIELISVVLGSPSSVDEKGRSGKYLDTQTLFDYGIKNFGYKTIINSGDIVSQIEIPNASQETKSLELIVEDSINIFMKNSDINNIEHEVKLYENITAPISANTVLGTITYEIDGNTYTSNLLAKNDVDINAFLKNLLNILFIGIILIITFTFIHSKKKKKRKKKNGKKSNENYLYGRVKY